MEVNNYLKKFKLLLEYVIEGKVVLNKKTTEKLLNFLEDRNDNSPGESLLETPCFSDVILDALENLPSASTSVKIFLVEIIAVLFKNELQFTKMQMRILRGSCIKYCVFANLGTNIESNGLHMACIKLANVLIMHLSGIKLLMEHKVWQIILRPNINQASLPIAKAAYKFISQLIRELNQYKMKAEIIEVLKYVMKPILTSEYLTVKVIDLEMDNTFADKIITYLHALLHILTEVENIPCNHIVPLLKSYFLIERSIYSILKATKHQNIQNLLNELNFKLCYANNRYLLFNGRVDEFCNEMVVFYHNCILHCIKKQAIQAITDFSIKCNIFWSKFEKTYNHKLTFPLTFKRNGQTYQMSNQLIIYLLEPILIFAYENSPGRTVYEKDESLDTFFSKIEKAVTEHIFTACFTYEPLIKTKDLTEAAGAAIRELFRLKSHLTPSQAGIYFQSLFHVLGIFIATDGAGGLILNQNPVKTLNDVRLLSLTLDALRMILMEHKISWYENIEIVSLQERLMNLLKQNILNTKQIVQVLDLIDLCVKKFLSPNMILLVESRQESTLTVIGAVMKIYMDHEDWEVRDSALNLLLSCTSVSFIKYIPLQKVISENKLMIIAAKAALTDTQYYVQSTGLMCLAAATMIECIWQDLLVDNPNIYMHLVYTLRNNPEGMVRKEAAIVLTMVYTNRKVSPTFLDTLYEVMIAAALDDLHWEVQLAALQFWKQVISTQLTNRGMIDGKFPSVTFSKEKRKIFKLHDKEILRQLELIMNELSSIGCLTVLCECMNEINNIEIMEQAYCMATKLIEILDKYKFDKNTANAITYTMTEHTAKIEENYEEMAMDLTTSRNMDIRDKVIDSILNMDQSELIMDLQIKSDKMENDRLVIPRKEVIHPNKFLEVFRGTDYRSIIKGKKKWNSEVYNSLDDLLDELLDVNMGISI